MDRVYQANAIETPPSTSASSGSYPTAGNKASGQLATVPGPYWFYSITEEIRNALIATGVTPDAAKVNQLAEALGKFLPTGGGTMTGAIRYSVGNLQTDDTDSYKQFLVGSDGGGKSGAFIALHRSDCPTDPGMLVAFTRLANGALGPALYLKPNGEIRWNYKDVVCVESWNDGSLYYRKYSDGWIEQGGVVSDGSSWTKVTFPTAFVNKPLNARYSLGQKNGAYANIHDWTCICDSITNTSMSVFLKDNNNVLKTGAGFWYASGY